MTATTESRSAPLIWAASFLVVVAIGTIVAWIKREMDNGWNIEHLQLWERPMSIGAATPALEIAALALVLLLLAQLVDKTDNRVWLPALLLLVISLSQAAMCIGFWVVMARLPEDARATTVEVTLAGELATRVPAFAIAVATALGAWSLLRDTRRLSPRA